MTPGGDRAWSRLTARRDVSVVIAIGCVDARCSSGRL